MFPVYAVFKKEARYPGIRVTDRVIVLSHHVGVGRS